MAYKFLYIDDEKQNAVSGTLRGLELKNEIIVKQVRPRGDFEKEITYLKDVGKHFSGLILDLNLKEIPDELGNTVEYSGTLLAQTIRESGQELPIVLFSATDKINNSLDFTGKDLFDIIQKKEQVDYSEFISKLKSLVDGYEDLTRKAKSVWWQILQLHEDENKILSKSFIQDLKKNLDKEPNKSAHYISQFILRELIEKEGLLISENILAIRLGVDIKASKKEDWDAIKQWLISGKVDYSGLFSLGWPRWWHHRLLEIWKKYFPKNSDLRGLTAEDRVELINDSGLITGKLIPIEKQPKSKHETFWTICVKSLNDGDIIGIDPADGFMMNSHNNYHWQDKAYMSIDKALHADKNELSDLEMQRLDNLKEIYNEPRTRT